MCSLFAYTSLSINLFIYLILFYSFICFFISIFRCFFFQSVGSIKVPLFWARLGATLTCAAGRFEVVHGKFQVSGGLINVPAHPCVVVVIGDAEDVAVHH